MGAVKVLCSCPIQWTFLNTPINRQTTIKSFCSCPIKAPNRRLGRAKIMKNIKNIRLKYYDYSSNGYYFVTICSNYRLLHLFSLGTVIRNNIELLNKIDGVAIDYWVMMKNHIHIIIILNNCRMKLGEIVRGLKARISKLAGFKVWQPNYYEHVIRSEVALQKIRTYIQNNPIASRIDFELFYK